MTVVQEGAFILLLAALVLVLIGFLLLRRSTQRRRAQRARLAALAAAHEAARHSVETERHANYHQAGDAPWPVESIVSRVHRERHARSRTQPR